MMKVKPGCECVGLEDAFLALLKRRQAGTSGISQD